jgi:K+-sensing histidine kinase KdpD
MPQQRFLSDLVLMLLGIVVSVGLSTLLAYLSIIEDVPARYLTFVPAVAVCCLLNGLRAGTLAAALSALSLWYFFIPPPGFALPDWYDTAHLLIFLAVAAFVCWIIEFQRRSNDQLAQENFELGYKVSLMRAFRSFRESAQR